MNIYACFRYRDCPAAIDFLCDAFGFECVVRYDDAAVVHHAELRLGDSMAMLGSHREGDDQPDRIGLGWTYIGGVEDADALCERARAAGAEITREPRDTDYGSRDFTARDPEGNIWSFGTYDPVRSSAA